MPQLFRQHSSVSCFFCQSVVNPHPRNPRSFRCPHCDCWNRYDAAGEIISEEPAMHDENLNARSFARRASPRKDRLPTMYGSTLFCHTCQTNQMLIANLLSNYLPSADDPDYSLRAESLPEYRKSVEIRYPPVCADCAPAVEEEIRKRDHMARTRALGGFLNAAKGNGRSRSAELATARRGREMLARDITMWKVRGCFWFGGLGCVLVGYVSVVCQYNLLRLPVSSQVVLPFLALVSIIWTAWDPTYASLRRAQYQGRSVRQRGKKEYIILQIAIWLSRIVTSTILTIPRWKPRWDYTRLWDDPRSLHARIYCSLSLALELTILMRSCFALQLQQPPAVRLMDTTAHKHLTSPTPSQPTTRSGTPAEPDLFAGLTLSSKPVMYSLSPTSNPIFGFSSMPAPAPSSSPSPHAHLNTTQHSPNGMDIEEDDNSLRDPDAMDWSPISPEKTRVPLDTQNGYASSAHDDGAWLRPQRFFAPEEPTGLENLFARTIKLADDERTAAATTIVSHQPQQLWWRDSKWLAASCAFVVLLLAWPAYESWQSKRTVVRVEL